MIDLSKKDRSRQISVCVNGESYLIHTEYYHWLNFQKLIDDINSGKQHLLTDFDYLYDTLNTSDGCKYGIPEDREAGYIELIKFFRNEQPLPRSLGKESDVKTFDWHIDSERIRAAFLEHYRIDLLTADLHWHDYQGLFEALLWSLESVMEARAYKEKTDKYEKIKKDTREMWRIETDEEKPIFEMR